MTLYEQVKKACKTNATTKQIAEVFGVSENIVKKVRELSLDLEKIEHPERFSNLGLRK